MSPERYELGSSTEHFVSGAGGMTGLPSEVSTQQQFDSPLRLGVSELGNATQILQGTFTGLLTCSQRHG
jgi:hypothetical protein